MLFLIFGLLCSAAVSIVLKIGERKEYNRYSMLTVNYITCLIAFLATQIGKSLPAANNNFKFCVLMGTINGLLYLLCMVMNQLNVKRNGAILQSTFARLGVMVPTIISIAFFGERPSWIEIIGILLVLIAVSVMNIPSEKTEIKAKPAIGLLLLSLLFGGISDSMSKVFEQYGTRALDDWFMGVTFFSAFIICLATSILRKETIGKRELLLGFALGVPNYISSLLLLKALATVSAYIAYPTYSVGAILVVITISVLFFRERISGWSRIGIVLIITAIIMLNI